MKIVAYALNTFLSVTLFAGCNSGPVDYDLFESTPALKIDVELRAQTAAEVKELFSDFTNANGYELYVGRVHPTNPEFNVILWRKDSMIIAVNPFQETAYEVRLYSARVDPASQESLASIMTELERRLGAARKAF